MTKILTIALWLACGALGAAEGPRLLVVTGGHPFETSFYTLFDGFNWKHAASPQEAYKEDIRPMYDVLVLYDWQTAISDEAKQNLRNFVESGKGLVILHHAIGDYKAWPWWYHEVVGGKYQMKADGDETGSTFKHDQNLVVRPVARHPVLQGIPEFHLVDETFKNLWISPGVTVLLRTDDPTSDGPVAWISPYPKSRVIYIQLGHDHVAHENPTFRALVKNAIQWAAGLDGAASR